MLTLSHPLPFSYSQVPRMPGSQRVANLSNEKWFSNRPSNIVFFFFFFVFFTKESFFWFHFYGKRLNFSMQ